MAPRAGARVFCCAFVLGACASMSPAPAPPPPLQALLRRDARWVGGDGAYSVALGAGRTLWLFGDSFIDRAADGERDNGPYEMVRNSVALQDATGLRFYWGASQAGASASFFRQPDGAEHWVWPLHGARLPSGELLLFRMHVRRTDQGLGFATAGWDAVAVDDPRGEPSAWNVRVVQPLTREPARLVGSAVLLTREHLYAYSVNDEPQAHAVYLARYPLAALAGLRSGALSDPEWFCGAAGFRAQSAGAVAVPLFGDGQVELSVHYASALGRFVLTQSLGGLLRDPATALALRFAPAPQGPWSEPCRVSEPKERARSDASALIAYAGKAHPEQSATDLVLSYVVNSLGALPREPLYYPELVRMSYARVRALCTAQLAAGR